MKLASDSRDHFAGQDVGVVGEDATDLLGETWTSLVRFCNEWLRSHPPPEPWEAAMSLADRQSIHLGAFLHGPGSREMEPWGYDATPQHSCVFASTGGDGEHYSVLLAPECRGVIVLTAPMASDCPNVVVGESMVDFLGLAVVSGLSTIPSVAYRGLELGSADIEDAAIGRDSLIDAVRDEFSVEPWPDVARRLQDLSEVHLSRVRPRRP